MNLGKVKILVSNHPECTLLFVGNEIIKDKLDQEECK